MVEDQQPVRLDRVGDEPCEIAGPAADVENTLACLNSGGRDESLVGRAATSEEKAFGGQVIQARRAQDVALRRRGMGCPVDERVHQVCTSCRGRDAPVQRPKE